MPTGTNASAASEAPAFNFTAVKKTDIDLFARAPQVKKMSRRDRHRMNMEAAMNASASSSGKAKESESGIFQTVFSTDDSEVARLAAQETKKGRKKTKRQVLRHNLHANEEEDERTAFVGNLPNLVKMRDVEKVFKDCGAIECVRIRCQALEALDEKSKNAGRAVRVLRGDLKKDPKYSATAYVLFREKTSVQKALTKNGIVFDSRHLVVTTLDAAGRAYPPDSSIFIGNVAYDTTEEDVWNFFVCHGISDVKRVRLVRDRETGDCKGFGYVQFSSASSVPTAIATRGNQLNNRAIRIVHVNKSQEVKASTASRREARNQDNKSRGLKRDRSDNKSSVGDQKRSRQDNVDRKRVNTPSWMGMTTNPRKKMPRDLRPLVADGIQHKPRGGRPPVKRKMRNPEK